VSLLPGENNIHAMRYKNQILTINILVSLTVILFYIAKINNVIALTSEIKIFIFDNYVREVMILYLVINIIYFVADWKNIKINILFILLSGIALRLMLLMFEWFILH
jgi:hypothetical protein